MKQCAYCKQEKTLDQFQKIGRYHRNTCNRCLKRRDIPLFIIDWDTLEVVDYTGEGKAGREKTKVFFIDYRDDAIYKPVFSHVRFGAILTANLLI